MKSVNVHEAKAHLSEYLAQVEEDVFRLKGFLEVEGELHYISNTGMGFSMTPAAGKPVKTGLTVLCPPANARRVTELWEQRLF